MTYSGNYVIIMEQSGLKYYKCGVKWCDFEREVRILYRFVGNFQHTLDAKGRMFLPVKYREQFSPENKTVVITRGMYDCLMVMPEDEWDRFLEGISEQSFAEASMITEYFVANATYSDIDGQGRIAIPANLREEANLTKEVSVVGLGKFLNIWDTARWKERNTVTAASRDAMREALSKNGFRF